MKLTEDNFIIYKYKVLFWELKKNKLLEIYNKTLKRKYGNVITNWNSDIKTKNYLKCEVENLLFDEINLFKNELKISHSIESAWFQEYNQNMDHGIHDHGIGYSSVVYIEYDSLHHKPTTFVNNLNKKIYSPKVDEGEIIFFNSKYNHFCPKNKSIKKRIICAFNLKKSVNIIYN